MLPEGKVSLWLDSKGLLRYGLKFETIQQALEASTFCGRKLCIRSIEWPFPNQKAPTQGPYWGVFLAEKVGSKEWDDIPLAVLIFDQGELRYASLFVLGGSTVQWFSLPGDPTVLHRIEAKQWPDETAYASIYWGKAHNLKQYLGKPHSRQELLEYVETLMKDLPKTEWGIATASSPEMLVKASNPAYESILRCDFEAGISYNEILAVALSPMRIRSQSRKTDWHSDTLANIYLKDGQAVGVVFDQRNVSVNVAPYSYMRLKDEWYLNESILYWKYQKE